MAFDIVVVGAGPAGLSFARALAGSGQKIALVERQAAAVLEAPADDGREIAVTHHSRRLLEEFGLWARLAPDEIGTLRDAQVLDGGGRRRLLFGHAEAGCDPLGWLVSNHALRRAAYAEVATLPEVSIHAGVQVTSVARDADGVTVTLDDGQSLHAGLLVAADSRFSGTRRALGIPADMHDFGKTMLVVRVRHAEEHAQTAWEWFGHGQTLALLPLADPHTSSVVLTLAPEAMHRIEALDDAALGADLAARFAGRLGAMSVIGPRCAYPLVGVYARRFTGERAALLGDAAVGMHPVTAHGFNFGLLGAATLARAVRAALAAGQPAWSPRYLRRYGREHRLATRPLYLATGLVAGLYTDDRRPARVLRKLALGAGAHLPPFRRAVMADLTSEAGSLATRCAAFRRRVAPPWMRHTPAA